MVDRRALAPERALRFPDLGSYGSLGNLLDHAKVAHNPDVRPTR